MLFGWMNNGWNQGGGRAAPLAPNNTLSLPRDLSVTSAGLLRQRFVPELRALRLQDGHVHLGARPLAMGGIPRAVRVSSGRQVEVLATFRVPVAALRAAPPGARQFGLLLLASSAVASDSGGSVDGVVYDAGDSWRDGAGHGRAGAGAEYTSITFDAARGHVLLDRRRSGAVINSDVRGGPWPGVTSGTTRETWREVTLHAYVSSTRLQPATIAVPLEPSFPKGCIVLRRARWHLLSQVDHAVVELIANASSPLPSTMARPVVESTAIAAWVQPRSAASDGIALWSEAPGVELLALDVWRLRTPGPAAV